jgi:hypothetical protein
MLLKLKNFKCKFWAMGKTQPGQEKPGQAAGKSWSDQVNMLGLKQILCASGGHQSRAKKSSVPKIFIASIFKSLNRLKNDY